MSDTDNKERQGDWRYKLLGWLTAAMARLPMWALYGVADLLFVVLYHLAGMGEVADHGAAVGEGLVDDLDP